MTMQETPWEMGTVDEIMLLMWLIVLEASEYRHLGYTLQLIAANGPDKAASMAALRRRHQSRKRAAWRLYELHRTLLGEIFVWTPKNGAQVDLGKIPFRFLQLY